MELAFARQNGAGRPLGRRPGSRECQQVAPEDPERASPAAYQARCTDALRVRQRRKTAEAKKVARMVVRRGRYSIE